MRAARAVLDPRWLTADHGIHVVAIAEITECIQRTNSIERGIARIRAWPSWFAMLQLRPKKVEVK